MKLANTAFWCPIVPQHRPIAHVYDSHDLDVVLGVPLFLSLIPYDLCRLFHPDKSSKTSAPFSALMTKVTSSRPIERNCLTLREVTIAN
jgi:hypothetical protein